jgi:hypothetical protein
MCHHHHHTPNMPVLAHEGVLATLCCRDGVYDSLRRSVLKLAEQLQRQLLEAGSGQGAARVAAIAGKRVVRGAADNTARNFSSSMIHPNTTPYTHGPLLAYNSTCQLTGMQPMSQPSSLHACPSTRPPHNDVSAASLQGAAPAPSSSAKVRHRLPMLSLGSQDLQEDVVTWQQRLVARLSPQQQALAQRWVVEPKIDGLAVCATYRAGRLEQVGAGGRGAAAGWRPGAHTLAARPACLHVPVSCGWLRGQGPC